MANAGRRKPFQIFHLALEISDKLLAINFTDPTGKLIYLIRPYLKPTINTWTRTCVELGRTAGYAIKIKRGRRFSLLTSRHAARRTCLFHLGYGLRFDFGFRFCFGRATLASRLGFRLASRFGFRLLHCELLNRPNGKEIMTEADSARCYRAIDPK